MREAVARSGIFDRGEQHQLKKLALLHEAARVFNERGFGSASLDDVAKNLNITKAALYYYFKSKQEILFECYQLSFDIFDDALAYSTEHGKTGRERLDIYIRRYIEGGLSALSPTISLRESEVLDPQYRARVEDRRHRARNGLRQIVADGIADGTIAPCNPSLLVSCIAGAISWVFRIYNPKGELSPAEIAETILEIMANGFAPRPKPAVKRVPRPKAG